MVLGFHKKSEGIDYIEQKYGVTPKPVKSQGDLLYSIYDEAEERFKPPFIATSDLSARRAVSEAINADVRSMLYKYSNEYRLFCLGSFNACTGSIVPFDIPNFVCKLSDLKAQIVSDSNNEPTIDLPKFVDKEN